MIIMDLLSAGFYLVDYFFTLGVNGLMRLLEIQNQEQIRPILDQVLVSTRSLPSLIMFAATSKCVLFLILNMFIAFTFTPAVWQICKENEDVIKTVRSLDIQQQQPVATVSPPEHDLNVRVTHIETLNNREEPTTTSYNPQPPYNPHLTETKQSKERETRF